MDMSSSNIPYFDRTKFSNMIKFGHERSPTLLWTLSTKESVLMDVP